MENLEEGIDYRTKKDKWIFEQPRKSTACESTEKICIIYNIVIDT